MENLDRNQLQFLSQKRALCVSIFLPTHRAGAETRQDPIRLKNLAKEAEVKLTDLGIKPLKAREIMAPVRDFARRGAFWHTQQGGLALFLSEGSFQYFRLPLQFQESVFVMESFEVSPLIPVFLAGGTFYLLAFSRKRVRFFIGTATTLSEITLPGIPRSLDEALKFDVRESQLQVHSGAAGPLSSRGIPRGAVGKHAAVFTGQGVGVDDEQARTLEFVLQVERGVRRALRDQQPPLLLAAVTEMQSVYRSVNKYQRLLDRGVIGNPDLLKPGELLSAALQVVRPYFDADRQKAVAIYQELAGTDRVSNDLAEILMAAYQGRIESVFLPLGAQKWGKFDFEDGALELHGEPKPGVEDLFNLIAIQTILSRGVVYAPQGEEIPGRQEVAAIFRFSTSPARFSAAQAGQA
jgi:Bacterial archaeo-eukaryotic release factor family 7